MSDTPSLDDVLNAYREWYARTDRFPTKEIPPRVLFLAGWNARGDFDARVADGEVE